MARPSEPTLSWPIDAVVIEMKPLYSLFECSDLIVIAGRADECPFYGDVLGAQCQSRPEPRRYRRYYATLSGFHSSAAIRSLDNLSSGGRLMAASQEMTRCGLVAAGLMIALCASNTPLWAQATPVTFDVQSVQNGRWSDPKTWSAKRIPTAGDFVPIRPRHEVI